MLRILTFSSLFPHAQAPGFGQFVADQSRQLARQSGCSVQVVAPLPRRPALPARLQPLAALPEVEIWQDLPTYRPRFTALPALAGWTHVSAIVKATTPVLEAIRASGFDFDVIDAEFFYPCGVAAAHLGEIFDRPVSIMARGSDIHYWGAHPMARRAILSAGQKAARMFAVSQAMKHDMISLGLDAEKIHVHYMGIDLARFIPLDRNTQKTKRGIKGPLLLSAGNLIALKGHDIMIHALQYLPDATLMIAGDGPEKSRLEKLSKSLHLDDRVYFLGRVSHADMTALMATADIMTLASEREGLATVWLESLACGTPVVAPAVGGIAEVITSPVAGRIARARTAPAMAEAVREILAAPPAQADVCAQVQAYDWQTRTAALIAHFSEIRR